MAQVGAAEQDAPPTDCVKAKIGRTGFLSHYQFSRLIAPTERNRLIGLTIKRLVRGAHPTTKGGTR